MSSDETVRPGQVWADNDPRSEGRTLRVDMLAEGKAYCTILTNPNDVQAALDDPRSGPPWVIPTDRRGKTTTISVKRFRATGSGYRLVSARAVVEKQEETQ